MKCSNSKCDKEGQAMIYISNFIVKYESWKAYNCCCPDCAKECAKADGINEDEITNIE